MSVTAKVSVILEINCTCSWNDNVQVSQIREQAKDSALAELARLANDSRYRIKLSGKPSVKVIAIDV